MNIPVIVLLLQGIPEGTAITTLAFVISRIPLKLNQILLIGTALAVCAYVVRLFPIPFGVHTILIVFILFIVLTILSKGDVGLSFMASILSCLALVIIETACLSLLMPVLSITPKILFTNHAVWIGLGEIHVLVLFTSAFLLNKLYLKRVT
ncbi:hypothetical protein JCM17380_08560 [Desulfosporosinus burensis]